MPSKILSIFCLAKIYFWSPDLTLTYSISSPKAKATFPGNVQGVVVQDKIYVHGSSSNSNLKIPDRSSTSSYPSLTSCCDNVVSQRGHICIDLWPS